MANSNITDLGAAIHRLYDARALLVVLADASVRDDGSLDHLSRVIRMTSDTIDEVIAGIDEISMPPALSAETCKKES